MNSPLAFAIEFYTHNSATQEPESGNNNLMLYLTPHIHAIRIVGEKCTVW